MEKGRSPSEDTLTKRQTFPANSISGKVQPRLCLVTRQSACLLLDDFFFTIHGTILYRLIEAI